jgi:excisionase family DNA binding protein
MDLSYEFTQIKAGIEEILELLNKKAQTPDIQMYDLAELQEILKVSRRTISSWTKQGILPHSKIGNKIWVSDEQLREFLKNSSNVKGGVL